VSLQVVAQRKSRVRRPAFPLWRFSYNQFVAEKPVVFEKSMKLLVAFTIFPNRVAMFAVLQAAFCHLQNFRRYAFLLSRVKTSLIVRIAADAVRGTSLGRSRVSLSHIRRPFVEKS